MAFESSKTPVDDEVKLLVTFLQQEADEERHAHKQLDGSHF